MTDVYEDRGMDKEEALGLIDTLEAMADDDHVLSCIELAERLRAYINDPGYVRVPEIGSHDMNELSTDFIYSLDDDDLRGRLYESRCVKESLHAALLKLSASKGEK